MLCIYTCLNLIFCCYAGLSGGPAMYIGPQLNFTEWSFDMEGSGEESADIETAIRN